MEVPKVFNPIKKESLLPGQSFMSYTLEVSSGRCNRVLTVERRYKDFSWLYDVLASNCPGALIPPLPHKQVIGRFDENFISSRMRGLEDFMSRILNHPTLGNEPYVHTFVESSDMQSSRSTEERVRQQKGAGSLTTWIQTKASTIAASPSELENEFYTADEDARIAPIKEHLYDTITARVEGVSKATQNLKQLWFKQGEMTLDNGELFLGLSEAVEAEDPGVGVVEREFGSTEQKISLVIKETSSTATVQVFEPLERHCDTVMGLKKSLAAQQEKRSQYLAAAAALDKKKAQGDSSLAELEDRVNRSRKDFASASHLISCDFEEYERHRGNELISLMKALALNRVEHCRQTENMWSELLPKIRSGSESSSPSMFGGGSNTISSSSLRAPSAPVYNYMDASSSDHVRNSVLDCDDDDLMIGV